jgi:hypothetical protein
MARPAHRDPPEEAAGAQDDQERPWNLHSIFDDALRNGWVAANPCRLVEKPDMSTVPMELHLLARVTTCTTPWVEGALTPA